MESTTKRTDYISWDQYFMGIAMLAEYRSKDPVRGVGSVIVDKSNMILSVGYNGFPRGCSDEVFPWSKEDKQWYVVHSELNAILNAQGRDLRGSTMYVTLFPCAECAKAIIQAGITTVIYKDIKEGKPTTRAAQNMLEAAHVVTKHYVSKQREVRITL